MPFIDPFRPQDHIDEVRKIGRLAQVLLDLRNEYEHKPRRILLEQLVERINEITALQAELTKALAEVDSASTGAAHD